jgi:DNA repair protein RadC
MKKIEKKFNYNILKKSELVYLLEERTIADTPDFLVNIFRNSIKDWSKENLVYIILNSKLEVLKILKFKGSVNWCAVDYAAIWKKILSIPRASSIALAHNHPGGNLYFSDQDIDTKNATNHVIKLFNFRLLDFLIVNETSYLSSCDTR